MRQQPRDRTALEQDPALRRPVAAGQQVEEGALPRPVRTDQAMKLAGWKLEADRIDRLEAAKHLHQPLRLESPPPAYTSDGTTDHRLAPRPRRTRDDPAHQVPDQRGQAARH